MPKLTKLDGAMLNVNTHNAVSFALITLLWSQLQFKDGDSDVTRLKKLLSWSSTYMNLPNGDSEHFDVFSYITE